MESTGFNAYQLQHLTRTQFFISKALTRKTNILGNLGNPQMLHQLLDVPSDVFTQQELKNNVEESWL